MLRRFGKIGMVYQHDFSVAELIFRFSSYAAGGHQRRNEKVRHVPNVQVFQAALLRSLNLSQDQQDDSKAVNCIYRLVL